MNKKLQVRARIIDGKPWFVAKDIADVLEYNQTSDALAHCKQSANLPELNKINNLASATKWIPESDVYRLVMRSNKPEAEAFQDWVVEDVLPTIRKTGLYSHNQKWTVFADTIDITEIMKQAVN